ncbi:MAG: DUF1836 domain-containing protein [Peptococcaceae bacterium]|nr:DUF1836 domain-containing protein [Peptococcaceae bacterium]
MNEYSQELNEWAKELAAFRLPRWEELPSLNLYMDQVVAYINETLEFLLVDPNTQAPKGKKEDRLLTSAMINNYVKQHFIPKPEKKRYHREHLACLIVYALFKQVLPLTDIQKGVYLQLSLCDRNFQMAYDTFCQQVEANLLYVADVAQGKPVRELVDSEMPQSVLGTGMAALSLASKILAQKVLALNTQDDTIDYGVEIEMNADEES